MTERNPTTTFNRQLARIAVGAYDDTQEVRKSMMNRVRDIVRKKNEGIPFDEVEDEKDEDDYDSKYDDDNLAEVVEEMVAADKLTAREEEYLLKMLDAAGMAEEIENQYENVLKITKQEPVYEEWLTHVYGVSHTLTARLIYQFGYCQDREKQSQIWAYAGLAPGQDRKRGEQLSYNPDAKTLAWLVADNMIKQGEKSQYRVEFYEPYKAEQIRRMNTSECARCGEPTKDHYSPKGSSVHFCSKEQEQEVTLADFDLPDDVNDEATPPWSRGHADNRARRYLSKKFLKHYWYITRDLLDLDTPDEWVITHGGHDKRENTFENPDYARRFLKGDV